MISLTSQIPFLIFYAYFSEENLFLGFCSRKNNSYFCSAISYTFNMSDSSLLLPYDRILRAK